MKTDNSITCYNCGCTIQFKEGARFCPNCGVAYDYQKSNLDSECDDEELPTHIYKRRRKRTVREAPRVAWTAGIICLIVAVLLVLAFFSKEYFYGGVSNREIQDDLKANVNYFKKDDMRMSSFEIIKRMTDKNDRTDIIYYTIIAENEYCEIAFDGYVYYMLYNDGWKYEDNNITSRKTTAKFYPTEEDAKRDIKDFFRVATYVGGKIDEYSDLEKHFYFDAIDDFTGEQYDIDLRYTLNTISGWSYKPMIKGSTWMYNYYAREKQAEESAEKEIIVSNQYSAEISTDSMGEKWWYLYDTDENYRVKICELLKAALYIDDSTKMPELSSDPDINDTYTTFYEEGDNSTYYWYLHNETEGYRTKIDDLLDAGKVMGINFEALSN